VLTTSAVADGGLLDGAAARVIRLDGDPARLRAQPDTRPPSVVTDHNLAYVIYTSGSTGLPKGAMNQHAAVANRVLWGQRRFGLRPGEGVLQKTPLSFDVSGWEIYWPLATGGRLVLARPDGHRDPGYLADLIARERVGVTQFVPSMLRAFLADGDAVARAGRALRLVICSGEDLTPGLAARLHELVPGAALHNLYGPTEAAIEVSAFECMRGVRLARTPIGPPIAGARFYVLDAAGEPVPIGAPGELHIGGVPVSRGYHRRPGLTAERFVPDPFEPGARLYRTGDLARFRSDGAVEYLGRLDQQTKIRGVRIELGEIEAALAGYPGVREVAVATRPGPGDQPTLVAYLVCAGQMPDHGALRRFLLARLPEAMVPSAWVPLAALPLGPSGKLDRAALPAPERDGSGGHGGFVAPRNPVESVLAEMWAQVIGVDRVGVFDDFFELGGHSLLATALLTRIRDSFGVELPMAHLLTGRPTVARVAEVIQEQQLADADAEQVAAILTRLGEMSDDEASVLLRARGLTA
jgi:amino acid adenylation domain-containing protein